MTLRVVDQGEGHFLDAILAVSYSLRLFTNHVENGLTSAQKDALTEASFTEASFTGYASAALTGGAWTVAAGNPASASYSQRSFTSTADQAPQNVYGYYVLRASDLKLEWYEYFSASATPTTVQYASESITVTPRMTLADTGD